MYATNTKTTTNANKVAPVAVTAAVVGKLYQIIIRVPGRVPFS